MPSGVFVSYRRDDTGWAATLLADALRRRLGPGQVFLDNSSIRLGAAFAKEIEDAVRRSAALLALIGQRWDTARLHDPQDWVRRELLLARDHGVRIVPVLVDRPSLPPVAELPAELRFLPGLQYGELRQNHPADVDVLADLLSTERLSPPPVGEGVEATRPELDRFLRFLLPPPSSGRATATASSTSPCRARP